LQRQDKPYVKLMSEKRLDAIGSHTLLDKQWADKPL